MMFVKDFFWLGVNVFAKCTTSFLFRSLAPALLLLNVKMFWLLKNWASLVIAFFRQVSDLVWSRFFPPSQHWQEILVIEGPTTGFSYAQYALNRIWIGQYHEGLIFWVVPHTPLNERLPMGSPMQEIKWKTFATIVFVGGHRTKWCFSPPAR